MDRPLCLSFAGRKCAGGTGMEDVPEDIEELPKSETELIALAKNLIALLTDNPKFADAPVSADEMRKKLDQFIAARKADAAAQAALLQATIARDQAVKNLLDAMGDRPTGINGSSPVHPKVWN